MDSTAQAGDLPQNSSELLPLVYEELRRLAAARLAREKPGNTLQATALVHEAWLRLSGLDHQLWNSPGHFFATAADVMRRILVDCARRKRCAKNGGHLARTEFDHLQIAAPIPDEELLALDDALDQLNALDPTAAQLVKLRFFAGLSQAAAAEQLGISRSTADRIWRFARTWLFSRIRLAEEGQGGASGQTTAAV